MKSVTIIPTILLLLAFGASVTANEKGSTRDTLRQFDEAPKPISGFLVEYPESAKRDTLEGTVFVSVYIKSDGSVSDVTVEKGVREDLDQAAILATKQSQWTPAKKNNVPIGVEVTVPIQFKLKDKKNK